MKPPERSQRRGLLIVYTGGGKGKTTAALGAALRAVGYGWNVLIIQFIKGTWRYGELDAAASLAPAVEIRPMGKGFVRIMGDTLPEEVHRAAAMEALAAAAAAIESGRYDLLILDEIAVALHEGLLNEEEVLAVLRERPAYLHVICTGRDAPPRLMLEADLVTEMREIKHPYREGIEAQAGIDF